MTGLLAGLLLVVVLVSCESGDDTVRMKVDATVHGILLTNQDAMAYRDLELTLNNAYRRTLRELSTGDSLVLPYASFVDKQGFPFRAGVQVPVKLEVAVKGGHPWKLEIYKWEQ